MTTAGDLRERVTIERAASTPDGAGGFVRGWAALAQRHAQVLPTTGSEREVDHALAAQQSYLITIRFGLAVTPADRVVWRGRTLNIRRVGDPTGRRTWFEIVAEDGVVVD